MTKPEDYNYEGSMTGLPVNLEIGDIYNGKEVVGIVNNIRDGDYTFQDLPCDRIFVGSELPKPTWYAMARIMGNEMYPDGVYVSDGNNWNCMYVMPGS